MYSFECVVLTLFRYVAKEGSFGRLKPTLEIIHTELGLVTRVDAVTKPDSLDIGGTISHREGSWTFFVVDPISPF